MKGKTCGACGKADGETRQEYRTPSEQLAKDAISYAHSWVLASDTCRDPSGNAKCHTTHRNSQETMNILHLTIHRCIAYLQFQHFSRMFHKTWICEAGEADRFPGCGVQMLLCWARAAVPAGLRPSENHHCQRWLPLPAKWWVSRKPSCFRKLCFSLDILHICQSLCLFSLLQTQAWIVLLWAASLRRASTWGILQKPIWPVAALLSVFNLIAFRHMTFSVLGRCC